MSSRLLRPGFALAFLAALAACGGPHVDPTRPVAMFGHEPNAQATIDRVREAWANLGRPQPADSISARRDELRRELDAFLRDFPNDGMIPLVRMLSATLAMDMGDDRRATYEFAQTKKQRPGTAADLVTTCEARFARLHGDPQAAMDKLTPLIAKIVDPLTRALFQEELVRTSIALGLEGEAVSNMDAWLKNAQEEERDAARAKIASLLRQIRRDVLEPLYASIRKGQARSGYSMDIQRALAERLSELAIESNDTRLARFLSDPNEGPVLVSGDLGAAINDLADSRRNLSIVEGRTVGLLVPTESVWLRDESADVLRGVMWALGLPRGTRQAAERDFARAKAGAVGKADAKDKPTEPCAHFTVDARLAAEGPSADDMIRLVTRDDPGAPDGKPITKEAREELVKQALNDLAGQGASVIIAALDETAADRTATWAEEKGIPVILLSRTKSVTPRRFAYVLGEDQAMVISALSAKEPALSKRPLVPVVDESEIDLFKVPTLRGLPLAEPVSCASMPTRAGEPRFPLANWAGAGVRSWLVTGSTTCARALVAELVTAARGGTVACTLEAALDAPVPRGLRVLSASSGVLPLGTIGDSDVELRKYVSVYGARLGFWTAIGHDAAVLARHGVLGLPLDDTTDPAKIKARRSAVRERLTVAKGRLWTSERTSLEGQTLPRSVCVTDSAQ